MLGAIIGDIVGSVYEFNNIKTTVFPLFSEDSTDYESAVRLSVSPGGDSDTLACITGGIAEAFYGSIPAEIADHGMRLLPEDFQDIVKRIQTLPL